MKTPSIIKSIIKTIIFIIICAFLGLATITGGSILADSYDQLEMFRKLEKDNLLDNPPSSVSEETKSLISIYHTTAAYKLSIESERKFCYCFILLFGIYSPGYNLAQFF